MDIIITPAETGQKERINTDNEIRVRYIGPNLRIKGAMVKAYYVRSSDKWRFIYDGEVYEVKESSLDLYDATDAWRGQRKGA